MFYTFFLTRNQSGKCVLSVLCTGTAQYVPASAVLFPPCLAGRQDMLVLAATLTQSSRLCVEIFRTHYLLWTSTLLQQHPSISLSITILSWWIVPPLVVRLKSDSYHVKRRKQRLPKHCWGGGGETKTIKTIMREKGFFKIVSSVENVSNSNIRTRQHSSVWATQ